MMAGNYISIGFLGGKIKGIFGILPFLVFSFYFLKLISILEEQKTKKLKWY